MILTCPGESQPWLLLVKALLIKANEKAHVPGMEQRRLRP